MSLFAITRGQWSMIDAVLHCLEQTGPAAISLWTWTGAEYDFQCLNRLRAERAVISGRLVVDAGGRSKHPHLIADWKLNFGADSVRYVKNHAKIVTISSGDGRFRLLLRGSMNLNANPRFEQFDLSDGGPAFDLVQEIEDSLPILPDNCTGSDVYAATGLQRSFPDDAFTLFDGVQPWVK